MQHVLALCVFVHRGRIEETINFFLCVLNVRIVYVCMYVCMYVCTAHTLIFC